jgi:hypothetical protein
MRTPLCPTSGKVPFPTRLHAEVRILDVERHAGQPFYSYECRHCGQWHLTRSPSFEALIEYNLTKINQP